MHLANVHVDTIIGTIFAKWDWKMLIYRLVCKCTALNMQFNWMVWHAAWEHYAIMCDAISHIHLHTLNRAMPYVRHDRFCEWNSNQPQQQQHKHQRQKCEIIIIKHIKWNGIKEGDRRSGFRQPKENMSNPCQESVTHSIRHNDWVWLVRDACGHTM